MCYIISNELGQITTSEVNMARGDFKRRQVLNRERETGLFLLNFIHKINF